MKRFLNYMLVLHILWSLVIIETNSLRTLAWTFAIGMILLWARLNYQLIIDFFKDEDYND